MSNTSTIDANNKGTWTAYNETAGQIERVYCDPVTNALLVFGVVSDGNTPATVLNAKIDANNNATITAFNETTGNVESLRCGTDGSLLVMAQ